jgi:hypothetical protein
VVVVNHVRREEQLNTALFTRKTIGIVMERYQVDEDPAFG